MDRLSDAARFGPLPDARASRPELLDWLLDRDPFRDGAIDRSSFDAALSAMHWVRIVGTRNTWDGDSALLGRMISSTVAGLWNLGAPVGLVMANLGTGLEMLLGTVPGEIGPLGAVIGANVPGTTLRRQQATPVGWVPTIALRASIDPNADPSLPAMVDRLMSLAETRWAVQALLLPIGVDEIVSHAAALFDLADHIATVTNRHRQLSAHVSTDVEDPLAARVATMVDLQGERMTRARRSGAFSTAIVISAPDAQQLAATVAATTATEPATSCSWTFTDPRLTTSAVPLSALTSGELIDLMRPPTDDVVGLPSRKWRQLDEHPEVPEHLSNDTMIRFGATEHGAVIAVPLSMISSHLLVTGATGSGKSTFVAQTLVRLTAADMPFMIVEPIKDEWSSLAIPGIATWRIGTTTTTLGWGLNPLEVPEGTSIATHLGALVSLFRIGLGLPDPLPHLVELGLVRAYEASGWDLAADHHVSGIGPGPGIEWPTLHELLEHCLNLPGELGYDDQIRANLRAALSARLGGLTRGPVGRLLTSHEPFPINEALHMPLVVNLDAIGDDNSRSFLMGLLLIRLVEHRRRHPSPGLQHVTLIEEAHRLMGGNGSGSTSLGTTGETADPVGATAALFGNLLSEIRGTGEGLVVIDQSPAELVRAAIVNTGIQVCLRAKERSDQEALGAAIGLSRDDQSVLAGLSAHEAVVSWEGMDAPIRTKLDWFPLTARQSADRISDPSNLTSPPPDPDGEIARAVAVLIRTTGADHENALLRLASAVDVARPRMDDRSRAMTILSLVETTVRRLGRRRGWDSATCDSATTTVLSGSDGPDHPARLLRSGQRPYMACDAVCGVRGCSMAELVEPEVLRLRAEGHATLVRLVSDPVEAYHRLRRRALQVIPEWAPQALQREALESIAVGALDEWADPPLVARVVAAVMEEHRT